MTYAEAAPAAPLALDVAGVVIEEAQLRLDVALARGEAAFVVGGGGVGKTLLMDALRLARPAPAERFVALGVDARALKGRARAALRRKIGAITQPLRFFEDLGPAQNVALPLRLAGRLAREYSRDVDELLAFVGLSETEERPMRALSETDRRRTALARALVAAPELIVADEPAAGLAPEHAQRVYKALLGMRRTGAAVLIATQDQETARRFDAPILRLDRGRLAEAGAP